MTIKNHDEKGEVNRTRFLFLLSAVILSVIGTNLVLHFLAGPQQVIKYKMHVIVGDHIGFDLNRKVITFGMLTPSGTATRHINIGNGDHSSKVRITAFGELADWIAVSDNNFVLQPYENKTLDVTITAPVDAEFGDYTGAFKISFFKSRI